MNELRKLKYRFVLIVMILLLAVVSAIFGGIYLTMLRGGDQRISRLLEDLARSEGQMPGRSPHPDEPHGQQNDGSIQNQADSAPEKPVTADPALAGVLGGVPGITASDIALIRNSFSVRLDPAGNILSLYQDKGFFPADNASTAIDDLLGADRASLESALGSIAAMGREKGAITISETAYRFLVMEKPYGSIVVFMDRSLENETLTRLISSLLMIGALGMVVLFLVSLFLADRAIRPAGKAWERQKRFIADASHELKTPLTVIAANTDVVLSNSQDTVGAQAKWLGYVKSEVEQMSKLVNDLLTIAKMDSSDNQPLFYPFDLSECVMNACLPLESLAFESGRELVLDIPANVTYIGEEKGIRQTVGILADNAIKHASGSGNIHLRMAREGDSGRIRIEVRNPGEGIPPDEQERIFERFYRPDTSRARETGGYGLGLSIAKSVAEMHHGTLSVHSIPNGETTFTLSLPPRKASVEGPKSVFKRRSAAENQKRACKRRKQA